MAPSSTMMKRLPTTIAIQWPAPPSIPAMVNTASASATWFRLKAPTRMNERVLAKNAMPVSSVSMNATVARSNALPLCSR